MKSIPELVEGQMNFDSSACISPCISPTDNLCKRRNETSVSISSQSKILLHGSSPTQYEVHGSNKTTDTLLNVPSKSSCSIDNRVFIEDIDEKDSIMDQPQRGAKRRLLYTGDVREDTVSTPSSKKIMQNLTNIPTSSTNSCPIDNRVFIEDIGIDEKENVIDQPKQGTKRRLFYPGDVREDEVLTPRSSKKFIQNLKSTINKKRRQLQNLHQKKRRAIKRISTLKSLVKELTRKNLVSENALESLKVLGCTFTSCVRQTMFVSFVSLDVQSFTLCVRLVFV